MTRLLIHGGRIQDPANGLDGVLADLAIENGKIRTPDPTFVPDRRLDATGCVVLPGGVDLHSHIAGASVNRARRLLDAAEVPVLRRLRSREEWLGLGGLVPPTIVTGHRYAALGYTTAVEAAVAPSSARQCRAELEDTPNVDRAFLLLLANHELILRRIAAGDRAGARSVASALLARTGAYGIKVVNPGGVALWKRSAGRINSIDQELAGKALSPRAILETLAGAARDLRLPHALHIHANRLGEAGNIETTLETSRALEGARHHLTHAQFHAYARAPDGSLTSGAQALAERHASCPELSLDVGQVMFEEALTLSADLALEHTLWQLTGRRYASIEVELETGCGMVPFDYQPRSRLHALQWAIGMELFLLTRDPWRLALTTDHPNGGSFLTYPKIMALLMSRDLRRETIARAHPDLRSRTALPDLDREYTLNEITIITRAAPARLLGLQSKGHLAVGADADVTIHDVSPDREQMFRHPRYVIKGGEILVEKGELAAPVEGRTFRASIPAAAEGTRLLAEWHERHATYSFAQFGASAGELARSPEVSA